MTKPEADIYDPFGEMLPFMLGEGAHSLREPVFPLAKDYEKYMQMVGQQDRLNREQMIAPGVGVVILHSLAGDGEDSFIRFGKYSDEILEHRDAAVGIRQVIHEMTVGQTDAAIVPATLNTINNAFRDPAVGHMIFIGHAADDRLGLGPATDYHWDDQPELSHLKRSFGVFGCATDKTTVSPPRVGATSVSESGVLYGIADGSFEPGWQYTFDNLNKLHVPAMALIESHEHQNVA